MSATQALGRYGENIAARYLQQQGYTVVTRNWRCEHGEIDIVAHDGRDVVICEVKTRRSTVYGLAQEAVTTTKLARLRRLALCWLDFAYANNLFDSAPFISAGPHRLFHSPVLRVDVVAVWLPARGPAHVEHFKAVG